MTDTRSNGALAYYKPAMLVHILKETKSTYQILRAIMRHKIKPYPAHAKLIHLGMALFGIAAFLTGELAEDGGASTGYLLHSYLGLSLFAVMLVRILMGFSASETLSFRGWSPFSRKQWQMLLEDCRTLVSFRMPERDRHQGMSGIVQFFGILLFTWMALTGAALFMLESTAKGEVFELVEEVHEVGELLIPLYLILHVGAVILHTLAGNPIWKKMFKTHPKKT